MCCWVALGCLSCNTVCGTDPIITLNDGKDSVLINKSGIMCLWIVFCTLIGFTGPIIILSLGATEILYFGIIPGLSLVILIVIMGWGKQSLVIDRNNFELYESSSGCCNMMYRRRKIASLDNIIRFHSTKNDNCEINKQPAASLFVDVKNLKRRGAQKSYKLISNSQRSTVTKACERVQKWWNQCDLSSKYNIGFDWNHAFLLNNYNLNNINQAQIKTIVVTPQKQKVYIIDNKEFKEFLLKIKLKDSSNGKLIDLAYEFEKNKIVEEYNMLKKIQKTDDTITDQQIIKLLVDKADNIIKSKDINNDGLPSYEGTTFQ